MKAAALRVNSILATPNWTDVQKRAAEAMLSDALTAGDAAAVSEWLSTKKFTPKYRIDRSYLLEIALEAKRPSVECVQLLLDGKYITQACSDVIPLVMEKLGPKMFAKVVAAGVPPWFGGKKLAPMNLLERMSRQAQDPYIDVFHSWVAGASAGKQVERRQQYSVEVLHNYRPELKDLNFRWFINPLTREYDLDLVANRVYFHDEPLQQVMMEAIVDRTFGDPAMVLSHVHGYDHNTDPRTADVQRRLYALMLSHDLRLQPPAAPQIRTVELGL